MNRRQFLTITAAGGLTALAAARFWGMGLSPSSIETVHVDISPPLLPQSFHGLKIAFLSDLHYGFRGVSTALIEKSLEAALAEKPDILCFGGDLITGWSDRSSLGEFVSIVRSVSAPMGVYGVLGNHEFLWGESEVMRAFEGTNIRLLRNETVTLHRGADQLPLVGLDNAFNQNIEAVRRQAFNLRRLPGAIVLEHTPDFAGFVGNDFRGVLLCGHTHGGQIILPFIGQAATSSRFGLRYVAGLYPVGHGAMYITRGVGAVLLPMRIGCPPEVTVLKLNAALQAQT